jgi:hypothetical protein
MTANCSAPSCKDVAVSVNGTDDAGFNIEFIPTEPGHYSVDVRYGGQSLPGGPLVLVAYDVSRIRVMGVRDGITNMPSTFIGNCAPVCMLGLFVQSIFNYVVVSILRLM